MTTSTTIGHFIHGEHANGGERTAAVFNPATGLSDKRVRLADKATVEAAIASAEKAYPAWRNTPPLKRARVMSRLNFHDPAEAAGDFADLGVLELPKTVCGRPRWRCARQRLRCNPR